MWFIGTVLLIIGVEILAPVGLFSIEWFGRTAVIVGLFTMLSALAEKAGR